MLLLQVFKNHSIEGCRRGCYNPKWMLYHLDERSRNGETVIIDNDVKFITIKSKYC